MTHRAGDPLQRVDEVDLAPYLGLRNLLELIIPQVAEYYMQHVMELNCHCPQCRRDVVACALTSLPPMYYGSLWARDLEDLKIQWRTLSLEAVDQQVRRAITFINEVAHHDRKGPPPTLDGVEAATPEQLARRIVDRLIERPLLEQLYGVPVPMCVRCNEIGRRTASKFCDRCGGELIDGLPSTSLRNQ